MEPKRQDAKDAVISWENNDPELEQVLSNAHELQLELTKEKNSHRFAMRKIELGVLGKFFGDGSNTSTFIAFISILFCFILIIINLFVKVDGINSTSASIITLALGYLFGKKYE
jgi:hypothetical protein